MMLSEYVQMFLVFFKIGSLTFGGGYAMLSILERELAEKRDWTTKEQLLDYYAIGQSTPGIIAVNVATFIGYNKKGILGACLTTTGVVAPSIIIITLIAGFLNNFAENILVQKALSGITVAVAALLFFSVSRFLDTAIKDWWGAAIFLLSFALILYFQVHSLFIIVGSALCGIAIQTATVHIKNHRKTRHKKDEK